MKNKHWLTKKFEEMIGAGKRFKSRNEMSQFLGLTETTRTTLFNFLDGTQTKYTIVFEWIEKLSLLDGGEDFLVPIIRRMGLHSPAQKVEGNDLPTIPVVGFVGAGLGYENSFNVEPIHSIAVLQEYILPGLFACKVSCSYFFYYSIYWRKLPSFYLF